MFSSSFSRENQPSELDFTQISSIGEPIDQSTPAYLFGGGKRKSMAPTQLNSSFGASAPSADIFASPAATQHASKSVHWSPALVQQKNAASATPTQQNEVAKVAAGFPQAAAGAAAPPLRSLRDQLEPAKKLSRRATFAARGSGHVSSPLAQRNVPLPTVSTTVTQESSQDPNTTTFSSTTQQIFQNSPQDTADTWVTVFGFQSAAQIPAILNLFSRHGQVVSHQAPPNKNWIHIRYSCVTHAHQALSRNATLFDQNAMIGVMPCSCKEIINGTASGIVLRSAGLNLNGLENASFSSSPAMHHHQSIIEQQEEEEPENLTGVPHAANRSAFLNASQFDTSLNSSRLSVRSAAGMRPLAAYNAENATRNGPNQAQNEGFLNKLWTSIGLH
ncbi:unnamed protein product [Caenorhabditis angaria]|uniref:Nucleoporin NUP35 n=1 Tax=Caenorhabditis angaria TaxID=860376 RepID=A0A9P1N0Q5_9PELO|nr:unnamed protein product [Caenorhabditis angaria]